MLLRASKTREVPSSPVTVGLTGRPAKGITCHMELEVVMDHGQVGGASEHDAGEGDEVQAHDGFG